MCLLQFFLLVCGLFIHSLDIAFCRAEVLTFNEIQLINYFSRGLCLWYSISKGITIPKAIYVFSYVIL